MTRRVAGLALCLLTLIGVACKADGSPKPTAGQRPTGTVRVGVWMPPDPSANTYGGAAVRALVLPHLFRATPTGGWKADLVDPGSDQTGRAAKTARFRFRPNARWSDGTPITADDLRRTMDKTLVLAVDDPTRHGAIVVRFTQPVPDWRRLWSGLDSVTPPKPDLWGGPYVVDKVTPNLETVLRSNPTYYGAAPHIRTVHLVLVPDPEIAARMMSERTLDVIAPQAFSARTARLERIKDAHVVRGSDDAGWTAAIVSNPSRLSLEQRSSLLHLVDVRRFVNVLLAREATALAPAGTSPAASPPTTSAVPAMASPIESSPASFLLRALQQSAHDHGITFDLRQGEYDQILGAYASSDFDVAIRLQPYMPVPDSTESVEQGIVFPLWRERPVAAVRDGLDGVTVNGFAVAGPAWNIENWHWAH